MKKLLSVISILVLVLSGCLGNQSQNQNTTQQSTTQPSTTQGQIVPPQSSSSNTTGQSQQRVFTLEELKKYNGKNGNPAYVAVDGIVYDVTSSRLWSGGAHEGCSNAGYDLTEAIGASPHGKELLSKMPVVGTLKK